MTHEMLSTPAPKRPYEIFGLTEKEQLFWRVSDERFRSLLEDELTMVHRIEAFAQRLRGVPVRHRQPPGGARSASA